MLKLFLGLLLGMMMSTPHASSLESPARQVQVDLFLSSNCPYCHKADVYFAALNQQMPWLEVHRYFINQNKAALELFYQHLRRQDSQNFSVPAVFFCGSHWIGFEDAKTSGKSLSYALQYCHQNIMSHGALTPRAAQVLRQWGIASQYQTGPTLDQHPLLLVLLASWADAFATCSLFSLALLLAYIGSYSNDKKAVWKLGLTYFLVLSVAHFTAIDRVGLGPALSQIVWAGRMCGVVLLLSLYKMVRHPLIKIRFLTLLVFAAVGLVVWLCQQRCFNMGYIFDQWLLTQSFSSTGLIIYRVAYQLFYLIPLLLLITACAIINRTARWVKARPYIRLSSWVILVAMALILLIRPVLMASFSLSLAVLIGSAGLSYLLIKLRPSLVI